MSTPARLVNLLTLSQAKRAVLFAIYHYAKHYRSWPSITEISTKLHKCPATIKEHLQPLKQAGYIDIYRAGKESGHRLTQQAYDAIKRQPVHITPFPIPRATRSDPGKLGIYVREKLKKHRLQVAQLDQEPSQNEEQPYPWQHLPTLPT